MDILDGFQFLRPGVGFQLADRKQRSLASDDPELVRFIVSFTHLYNLLMADVNSDLVKGLSEQSRNELVRARERAKDVSMRHRQRLILNNIPVASELEWQRFIEGIVYVHYRLHPGNSDLNLSPWLLKLANVKRMRLSIVVGVIGVIIGIVASYYKWWLGFIGELVMWPVFEVYIYREARWLDAVQCKHSSRSGRSAA